MSMTRQLSCPKCEGQAIKEKVLLYRCDRCQFIGILNDFRVSYFSDKEQSKLRILSNQVKTKELFLNNSDPKGGINNERYFT